MQDDLYSEIKKLAAAENRSVSQQVVFLLKEYISRKNLIEAQKTSAQVLLSLSGSWQDGMEADLIIDKIKQARRKSTKLSEGF
jgi:hypothetical protein